MIRLIPILLFLAIQNIQPAYAQTELRKVWGELRDAQSLEAISIANISTGMQGTYTDLDGHFMLSLKPDDTLHISHISYHPYDVMMQEMDQDTLLIYLMPRTTTMQEVVIRGLPSEEKFKQEMIQLVIAPSQEEQLAKANVNIARSYFLSGYVPQMDSDDNYHWYIAGPQEVTIFSSGPTGGLFRALNNINRSQGLLRPARLYQNQIDPDSLWQNVYRQIKTESDSVVLDSLLTKEKR